MIPITEQIACARRELALRRNIYWRRVEAKKMSREKAAVKLPDQFAWLAEQEAALNRQDGRRLAEWARGGKVSAKPETPASEASAPTTAVSSVALPTEVEIWAEAQDFELEARAGDEAAKWFNDAMKDPMWSKLRGLDAGRAAALKAKALDRRKMVAA